MAMILPVAGHEQELAQFAQDFMQSLGTTNPAIILDPDQMSMTSWANQQSASILAVPTALNDANVSIYHLNNLISLDEINLIMFTIPIASQLIKFMANELGTLNPKTPILIPHGYPVSFPLRLDSRLFIYKISGRRATLFEKYNIRLNKVRNLQVFW